MSELEEGDEKRRRWASKNAHDHADKNVKGAAVFSAVSAHSSLVPRVQPSVVACTWPHYCPPACL